MGVSASELPLSGSGGTMLSTAGALHIHVLLALNEAASITDSACSKLVRVLLGRGQGRYKCTFASATAGLGGQPVVRRAAFVDIHLGLLQLSHISKLSNRTAADRILRLSLSEGYGMIFTYLKAVSSVAKVTMGQQNQSTKTDDLAAKYLTKR
jgi:hypothetical protein